jgi:hypothetical protein
LGGILLRIAELKLSGLLTLASDMGRRTIYFHSGFAVFSESSLFGERLGAVGVRHGLVRRNNVAKALAHARERSCGLGQALLELEYMDQAGLFALLGIQLREVVAASCGSEPLRARFSGGRGALRGVVVLRLHPLTAVLTAIVALPDEEQRKLLDAVGQRRVLSASIPPPAAQWLADLGYFGDLDRIGSGEPLLSALRSRLVARYRSGSERYFDPAEVPFSLPAPRDDQARPNPAKVADLATLTLLMSGALKLAEPAGGSGGNRASSVTDTTASLQLSFDGAVDRTSTEIRAGGGIGAVESDADPAIAAYLMAARERELAGGAAVWGPSVEARDPLVPAELIRLYLTLKPEKRPAVVLGVSASAPSEQVTHAYARRAALLASMDGDEASPHLRCRVAELAQCFDDALEKLLPESVAQLSSSKAGAEHSAATGDPPARSAGQPALAAAPSTPAPAPVASVPPPPSMLRGGPEAIAQRLEALMRAGNWPGVLETIDAQGPLATLPFTLRLARAMAQRELENRYRARRWPLIAGLALGVVLGLALQYFGRPLLTALGLQ